MTRSRFQRALTIFSLLIPAFVAPKYGTAQAAATTTTVNLTAQRMSLSLPDGKTAPMWGFCASASCSGQWTPGPTITVPSGNQLTITLTNKLPAPTSIVILGQLGGPLGSPVMMDSPAHEPKTQTTWPTAGKATVPFTPPTQASRVQSFGTETGPATVQSYTWTSLSPGTYLYETGTHPSIQAPMGLYGVIVVTKAPNTKKSPMVAGVAYPGVTYDADATMLLSEIDLAQNTAVDALAANAVSATNPHTINPWSYPPAINYAPTYFLLNGQPFNRSSPSSISIPGNASTGNVMLRFVNAGLKTHVPSVVGLNLSLIAEDGNVLPGKPKVQSELLLPAGKTGDVLVTLPTAAGSTSGVLSFVPASYGVFDRQLSLSAGNTPDSGMQTFLRVNGGSLPAASQAQAVADAFSVPTNATSFQANVLTNDVAVYSATLQNAPTMAGSGAPAGSVSFDPSGSFLFTPVANVTYPVTFSYCGNGSTAANLCAGVTLNGGTASGKPIALPDAYTSNVATYLRVARPGVLANDTDPSGYTLKAVADPANPLPAAVTLNADGSFTIAGNVPSFTYVAVNSQGLTSAPATVTLTMAHGSGLAVAVTDVPTKALVADYRWTIEEDTTYKNNLTANAPGTPANTIAVNFHKSFMPLVATGCTGPLSCGSGQKMNGAKVPQAPIVMPGDVYLDPAKSYFISVLPGDAANAFNAGNGAFPSKDTCTDSSGANICGHTMGGSAITPGQTSVSVLVEPNPLPTSQLSIFVFEDNNPTNADIDGNEENQGLGGFQVILNDTAGRTGDPAGQIDYDAFNMPLTNALMGTPGCPAPPAAKGTDPTLQGMVITCPDGIDPTTHQRYALAGQALIKNLMPGRFDVLVNPGAAREAAGEKWYQVSTLEGTHANDAFAKAGEPAYFQEFGPPGFHAFVGFVNPDHIAAVNKAFAGTAQVHSITGQIVNLHMSRPINENLYPGTHDPIAQTTCYVGLNSQAGSGADVAFTKCNQDGTFKLTNVPDGAYQIVVWDEWLDLIIEAKDVTIAGGDVDMKQIPAFSWFTHMETSTFLDTDGKHKPSSSNPGLAQVPFNIRFRDGSFSNKLVTDSNGNATFDELFPLFNWYVLESDRARYKGSAVHVVVDGGGQPDAAGPYTGILNSTYPTGESTERIDPGTTLTEGMQGFINQTEVTDWGKVPYAAGETGGITGTVVYSSTRPFDDPRFLIQNIWEPMVPRVQVNLYQEATAPDGSQTLQFIESTQTTSWDDVADATGIGAMQCPGQVTTDPFVVQTIGLNNIKKCYDGFHSFNQVQPAVYDGRYNFLTMPDGATPLPAGKYVVEMVLPNGYEVVKEEDKNILIGDAWVAPAAQQFGALTNIFILPDQAEVGESLLTGNTNNPTANLGRTTAATIYPACVGSLHRVPDFISLFPGSGQVAPFAGADRPLCDRKEVVLNEQMQSEANFYVFTSAHIASHFTGMILNDAASEMNAASPDFGEKFAVPNVPISIKDFNGIEIQRLYADQWGNFNGLTPSSWQVNVPNPAGYSPNMLITCMNDPGPIPDGNGGLMTDPNYNPMYSNFCYTNAFMPGLTDYLDTPVVPVAAFATGYNTTDCAYPDATPAIKRVDGNAIGVFGGPYLTTAGGTLTITALGDQTVPNPAYGGPSATTAPGNQRTITRHYGFGTQGPGSKITIGGVDQTANVTSWSDGSIAVQIPKNALGGQMIITSNNGKSTVDAITVTIEDRKPVPVQASKGQTIQAAIETANPGDLILVDAGTYNELAIMWKPVRLQGVGAASVIINAAKYPTNKLEVWRPHINSLFGLDAAGNQLPGAQVDPLPGQSITGGAILLEPSVLGQEEGAGITVLAKNGTQGDCRNTKSKAATYVSNFLCNPSRIDGISVTGGDAGGGIFVNGWAHNIEIANNRVYGNAGSFHGGIRIGIPYLEGLAGANFGFDKNVHIHHNSITKNGTIEANKGDSGAGGGVSLCSGTDNYLLNYNFICGNFASTDGGGIGHIGVSDGGVISHNQVLFNQSYAQSNTVNGGGISIEGEAPTGAGLSQGTGNVTVDSNLIQGNFAESGSGGGIRLESVNGAEIARRTLYRVNVTNNIIVDNVAGLAGGGISLADTLGASVINNTVASNDSVGIVGALFTVTPTTSRPNPAGISSDPTSPPLVAASSSTLSPSSGLSFSNPTLQNNIVWHNRSFFFDAYTSDPTKNGVAQECASNNVNDAMSHTCSTTNAYWDLGIVGDASATPGANKLNPTYSVLDDITNYATNNSSSDPLFTSSYFNASTAARGQLLPNEAYAAFATLDEGGNFIDMTYGPLTVTGDYRVAAASSAVDHASAANAPGLDYFGTKRPQGAGFDIGAYEYATAPPMAMLTPASLDFGKVQLGSTSAAQIATLTNTGTVPVTVTSITFNNPLAQYSQTNNCGTVVAVGTSCQITIVLKPTLIPAARNTTLTVLDGAGTQTVTLTGAGVAPSGTLSTNRLTFGTQATGTTSTPQVVTLFNTGVGPLTSTVTFTSTQFKLGPPLPTACGATLLAGASCTFNVVFAPTSGGTKTGNMVVNDGLGFLGTAQTVALRGN